MSCLKVIGRGSYGEIWLARSLTGVWRAVKIVDRATFDSDRAFQREFEGMAKFEPISRSMKGSSIILHVGRDEADRFSTTSWSSPMIISAGRGSIPSITCRRR